MRATHDAFNTPTTRPSLAFTTDGPSVPATGRRAARRAVLGAVLGAGALAHLAACRRAPADVADGDDPLAALTVTAESKRYDELYWRAHRDSKDSAQHALYTKAVEYCSQKGVAIDGAKPNCRGVMTTRALESHGDPSVGGRAF